MENKKSLIFSEVVIIFSLVLLLAIIIVVAINPAKQFALARNAQRWSNVNTILNAVWQVQKQGNLPSNIGDTLTEICQTNADDCSGMVDLSALTDNGVYLLAIPSDPNGSGKNGTGYFIQKVNEMILVSAPKAELGVNIEAQR